MVLCASMVRLRIVQMTLCVNQVLFPHSDTHETETFQKNGVPMTDGGVAAIPEGRATMHSGVHVP